jgi:hypothetical protein
MERPPKAFEAEPRAICADGTDLWVLNAHGSAMLWNELTKYLSVEIVSLEPGRY